MKLLQDKVAVVTGSTSGIGEAIVRTFAAHGAKVVVTGRNEERGIAIEQAITETGGHAFFLKTDLSDPEAPALLVDQAVTSFGGVDLLVNNAALVCSKPVEALSHQDWDDLFSVNVKVPFFLVQQALPWLKQSKGQVLNISSTNAWINCERNLVYDSMKAALNHMTRGLSLELREAGIRVNAIMPGGTVTPLLNQWADQFEGNPDKASEMKSAFDKDPSVARPQQIADAALAVACGFGAWINGACIPVDGGYHIGW